MEPLVRNVQVEMLAAVRVQASRLGFHKCHQPPRASCPPLWASIYVPMPRGQYEHILRLLLCAPHTWVMEPSLRGRGARGSSGVRRSSSRGISWIERPASFTVATTPS